MGGQHYTALKDGDKQDDNRQTKTEFKTIFTEAEPFIGKHHTSLVIWKQEGKCGTVGRKMEEKNLMRSKKKASTQYQTFTKCSFNFFHMQA